MILMLNAMPPIILACGPCTQPPKPPPHHGGGGKHPSKPPSYPSPPVIIIPPPVQPPPVIIYPPPPARATCPIDALKLGLCLDVAGGIVHVGIGNPVENICCPVIQGLLDLEAAICLCTVIRIKLLNLNIFIPVALQVLATCGMTPPPGFVCPPLK
ncbi:hypothetical protein Ahy_B01g053763 isoform A [Arachis hypogaea]|uniref:Bifunctional inhibitor/plant lipid transfer protein/seed storage helical domain-containing protein n=1 Tax=Arachis hypogaea TaxID=3818 RepID=A0A445ASI7_ARAHY|nr:hypothetical protein Ahy_B01g053763 isoform A [Arachis hypogaea]